METNLRSDTHKAIKVGKNYCLQFILFAHMRNGEIAKHEKSITKVFFLQRCVDHWARSQILH